MTSLTRMMKQASAFAVLVGYMALCSASGAEQPADDAQASSPAPPSPAVQIRLLQFQQLSSVFEGATMLIKAETDHAARNASQDERVTRCHARLAPARTALASEAMRLKGVLFAGHSCDGNSPDECWLPVFDDADRNMEAVTSQAQQLYKALVQCRT